MNTDPDSWQFRSYQPPVDGGRSGGVWSEWGTCTHARALELAERDRFEVRAVFIASDTEQVRGLHQLCGLLEQRLRDNRVRLLAAMAYIRAGETEDAMTILRLVADGRP